MVRSFFSLYIWNSGNSLTKCDLLHNCQIPYLVTNLGNLPNHLTNAPFFLTCHRCHSCNAAFRPLPSEQPYVLEHQSEFYKVVYYSTQPVIYLNFLTFMPYPSIEGFYTEKLNHMRHWGDFKMASQMRSLLLADVDLAHRTFDLRRMPLWVRFIFVSLWLSLWTKSPTSGWTLHRLKKQFHTL